MDISLFFTSPYGMYITQAFCHSLIAAFIVDVSLQTWKIEAPVVRQRFRFIVILFPVVSFPLYQLINPNRGTLSFRFGALFDVSQWMNLQIWGSFYFGHLVVVLLVFTTFIFIFQEMIPIVQHALESHEFSSTSVSSGDGSPVGTALSMLPEPKPDVFLFDEDDLVLFSTTGKKTAIYISHGFAKALSVEDIEVAMAHEIGHIARSRRPLLIGVFLLRMILFFNPVAMMEFRRIVQEEEKICDDFAVSVTGSPASLAEILRKFYSAADIEDSAQTKEVLRLRDRLGEYSHAMSLKERISRLEQEPTGKQEGAWFIFVLTLAAVAVINYSVV